MTRLTALASVICSLVDVSTINLASVKLGSKGWLCFPAAENKNEKPLWNPKGKEHLLGVTQAYTADAKYYRP